MALLQPAGKLFLAGHGGQEADRPEGDRFERISHQLRKSYGAIFWQDSIEHNLPGRLYHGSVYRKTAGAARSVGGDTRRYGRRNLRVLTRPTSASGFYSTQRQTRPAL